MANRVELNDTLLDDVTGGSFNFYLQDDDTYEVVIDKCSTYEGGTFHASGTAKNKINYMILQYKSQGVQKIVDECVKAGYLY